MNATTTAPATSTITGRTWRADYGNNLILDSTLAWNHVVKHTRPAQCRNSNRAPAPSAVPSFELGSESCSAAV
jgi:hypothetical protein